MLCAHFVSRVLKSATAVSCNNCGVGTVLTAVPIKGLSVDVHSVRMLSPPTHAFISFLRQLLICRSECSLLTGGLDGCVKLWSVRMAIAEPRGTAVLKATSLREQPVQKVVFTPFGRVRSNLLLATARVVMCELLHVFCSERFNLGNELGRPRLPVLF